MARYLHRTRCEACRPRWNYAALLNFCRESFGDIETNERLVPVLIRLNSPVPSIADLTFKRSEVEDAVDSDGAVVPKERAGFEGCVYPLHTSGPIAALIHPDGGKFNFISKAWPRIAFLESVTANFPAAYRKDHFAMTSLDILPNCPEDRFPCGYKCFYAFEEVPKEADWKKRQPSRRGVGKQATT